MFYAKYNIDTRKISDYSLLAGLHCQSVLTDRFSTASELFHLRDSFACKLLVPSRCGRTGEGHLWCAGVQTSLSTLFRSATINLKCFGRIPIDQGVCYAHYCLFITPSLHLSVAGVLCSARYSDEKN